MFIDVHTTMLKSVTE